MIRKITGILLEPVKKFARNRCEPDRLKLRSIKLRSKSRKLKSYSLLYIISHIILNTFKKKKHFSLSLFSLFVFYRNFLPFIHCSRVELEIMWILFSYEIHWNMNLVSSYFTNHFLQYHDSIQRHIHTHTHTYAYKESEKFIYLNKN